MKGNKITVFSIIITSALLLGVGHNSQLAEAALLTDPNDPRSWQGATVGTFAELYFGGDTPANRQLVIDNELLDDGIFDPTGSTPATLEPTPWALGTGGSASHNAGDGRGTSHDSTGTGSYGFTITNGNDVFISGNVIDNLWFQSSNTVGDTVFDLGIPSSKAAIFNTIDHGPLPQEAIETTVWLSNDKVTWTQAEVQRVWLEGFEPILGIQWDGFVFAVGTPAGEDFQYASTTWGGPGALIADGDDEINGVLGLDENFEPTKPEGGPIFLTCDDPDFHAVDHVGSRNLFARGIEFIVDPTNNAFSGEIDKFLFVNSNIGVPGGHRDGINGLIASVAGLIRIQKEFMLMPIC